MQTGSPRSRANQAEGAERLLAVGAGLLRKLRLMLASGAGFIGGSLLTPTISTDIRATSFIELVPLAYGNENPFVVERFSGALPTTVKSTGAIDMIANRALAVITAVLMTVAIFVGVSI